MNNIQGWLNLYKPENISSFQALNKIKKKFSINKIGHAGTLDPLAKGILPLAIGKTTKLISYVSKNFKKYKFDLLWGIQTSTDDSCGDILFKSKIIPDLENIILKSKNFIGKQVQKPPKVSANKIDGKRAYKLFREKIEFETKDKEVFVKNLRIVKNHKKYTTFEIECGKGFYIRSLARDLAIELGTYGHVSSLERLKVGKFNKESSILLDDLLKISERLSEINYLLPSISMLDDILAFEIEKDKDLIDISLGKSIILNENIVKKFSFKILDKNNVFLSKNGDVVSIGKLVGNLFKPNKVLI